MLKMHKFDQLFEEMLFARNKKLYTIIIYSNNRTVRNWSQSNVTTVVMAAMTIKDGRNFGF
jgi:hypothetical protein